LVPFSNILAAGSASFTAVMAVVEFTYLTEKVVYLGKLRLFELPPAVGQSDICFKFGCDLRCNVKLSFDA
jgi:hypothetical protein